MNDKPIRLLGWDDLRVKGIKASKRPSTEKSKKANSRYRSISANLRRGPSTRLTPSLPTSLTSAMRRCAHEKEVLFMWRVIRA